MNTQLIVRSIDEQLNSYMIVSPNGKQLSTFQKLGEIFRIIILQAINLLY